MQTTPQQNHATARAGAAIRAQGQGHENAFRDAASAGKVRAQKYDIARGIAIVLVVLGHALVGIRSVGADSTFVRFLLIAIYAVHMPVFFIISGVFAESMRNRPWPAFARLMAVRIVWPYLLWGFVLYSAHYVMSGHTNTAIETYSPVRILLVAPAVMWFLQVLLAGMILWRLSVALSPRVVAIVGALVFAGTYIVPGAPQEIRFVGLFLAAAALGRAQMEFALRPAMVWASTAVFAATLIVAWMRARTGLEGYPAFAPAYLPAALAGPVLLIRLSALIERHGPRLTNILQYIGQRTMPIFVTHILITAGARIALQMAGIDSWGLAVLAGTTLGVALPLLAARIAETLGLSPLLGWR